MLAGRVVAVLGRERQPAERFDPRLVEVARAVVDELLEHEVLLACLELQEADLQQVLDPQQHLDHVEGLGQEVAGAARQRALLCLDRDVGRDHEHREPAALEPGLQLREHLEPVRIGHVEVEDQQVRRLLRAHRHHVRGVHRALDRGVAVVLEHALQQLDVGGLIVDDQDARVLELLLLHRGPEFHRPTRARALSP